MRRLAVTLAAIAAAALSVANAQDGGCTDFMTMQANYMALVHAGSFLSFGSGSDSTAPSLAHPARVLPAAGDGRVLRRAGRGLLRRLPRHLCVPASPA